jgi:hypothetical protein
MSTVLLGYDVDASPAEELRRLAGEVDARMIDEGANGD